MGPVLVPDFPGWMSVVHSADTTLELYNLRPREIDDQKYLKWPMHLFIVYKGQYIDSPPHC
jgi:hypothetical protein